MQLFVTDKGFVYVVPMKSQAEIPLAFSPLSQKEETSQEYQTRFFFGVKFISKNEEEFKRLHDLH